MRFQRAEQTIEPPEPPRGPERQALAAAIDERDRATRIAKEAREAANRAADTLSDVRISWRSAKSRLVELRENGVCDRAEIAGSAAREAALGREVESAKAAYAALDIAADPVEREAKRATLAAERAAEAVLAAHAGALLEEIGELRERLVNRLGALIVVGRAVAPGDMLVEVQAALAHAKNDDFARLGARSDACDDWRSHAAALLIDAGAVAPPR